MNPLRLEVADVWEHTPESMRSAADEICKRGPRDVPSRKRRGLRLALWGHVAQRYLGAKWPTCWIYRGGAHVAFHERKPTADNPDAGRCFFRIVETRAICADREVIK